MVTRHLLTCCICCLCYPVAGFSAVPIFTTLMISSFNMIFTACPIVAYAVLEQDMHVKTVLANPASYAVTRTATRGGFFG
jgi:hypothetical protein